MTNQVKSMMTFDTTKGQIKVLRTKGGMIEIVVPIGFNAFDYKSFLDDHKSEIQAFKMQVQPEHQEIDEEMMKSGEVFNLIDLKKNYRIVIWHSEHLCFCMKRNGKFQNYKRFKNLKKAIDKLIPDNKLKV